MALLVVGFHFLAFGRPALDRAFFDTASRHPFRAPTLPANSAFVLVNDSTMAVLGREPYNMRWPFRRSAFAALIAALDRAGAERILVDFTFFDQSESVEQDLLLAAVAAASPRVVLASAVLPDLPEQGPIFWDEAFRRSQPGFFTQPRTGNVTLLVDSDNIARHYEVPGSLAAAAFVPASRQPGGLLRWQGGLKQIEARGVPVLPAGHFIIAGLPIVERLSQSVPDLAPAAIGQALLREPPLTGPAADAVRGRVVFVGANANGTYDLKAMPVGKFEPAVLLHWTAWSNLAGDGFVRELPPWSALLVAAGLGGLMLRTVHLRQDLTLPLTLAIGLVVALLPLAYIGISFGWYFPPATPVAAVLLTLLGVVAENFWLEQARKREIQSMFGVYVDPGVVAQLVKNPDSIRLRGEKRDATVFFSDLAGFTELSEKLKDQPEQMVEVVNAYLDATSECLLNHGAYVDKYIGDAVMAVFGVPQPLPDHALAACRAALAAQQLIPGINARYAAAVGVNLAVRIGLNTGELIVGNVGSSRKKNYTVMNDTVNLASRLEGANKVFGTHILIGEETARRVQGVLATRPLARLRVKGKQEAIEVHTLLGERADLSPAEREFLAAYLAGYDAYVNRRFAEAAAALTRAGELLPHDLTTRRLREESARYSQTPPPADWEPILILETK